MKRLALIVLAAVAILRPARAGTLATFQTGLGNMDLEFYDDDKPVTVSNFIKYVVSGRFDRQFIQRWEPNFVIQGGGYFVTNNSTGPIIDTVPTFANITNEYSVGKKYSNTYGTIAMARQGGVTNSASSQWFLNLTNNAFLDNVDGGFTVFGHVIGGTNILNLFVPPPPTNGIYSVNLGGALNTLPTLSPSPTYSDLIYVKVLLRRDVSLALSQNASGQHVVNWSTVKGVTNSLQFSTTLKTNSWTTYTNVLGNGSPFTVVDSSTDRDRVYRVILQY